MPPTRELTGAVHPGLHRHAPQQCEGYSRAERTAERHLAGPNEGAWLHPIALVALEQIYLFITHNTPESEANKPLFTRGRHRYIAPVSDPHLTIVGARAGRPPRRPLAVPLSRRWKATSDYRICDGCD